MIKKKGITKRIAAILASCVLAGNLFACDLLDEDFFEDEEEIEDEEETPDVSDNSGQNPDARMTSPYHLNVDLNSGDMEITRPESQEIPMANDGSWTIFVYVCGSNLESDGAAASDDIEEMRIATASDKVRFVVETGGCEYWQNDYANDGVLGKFLIEDNEVIPLEEIDDASMGDSATLAEFLNWGVKEYPGEKMGVVLWNHGGGSISGVCFDDNYDSDSLTLRDLDSALYSAFVNMTDRFEFVGFDACLMGTVETANILASYSRYMVGSQELEPGSGWDYTAIGDFLAEHPEADGAELGKVICDGFYDACERDGQEDSVTLSVTDLDKIDNVLKSYNAFAKNLYAVTEDSSVLSSIIREINDIDNFGGNNDNEGYTNMVDLGGLIKACDKYVAGTDAINAVNDAIVYNKAGFIHDGCSGLSVYYPLQVQGSTELGVFEDITISPYYAAFVDRQDFTSSLYYDPDDDYSWDSYYDEESDDYYFNEDGINYWYDPEEDLYCYYDYDSDEWIDTGDDCPYDYSDYDYDDYDSGYDDDYWFSDPGDTWDCGYDYTWDDERSCFRANVTNNDHWNYADDYSETGESRYITFLKEPGIDKDGYFVFTLDARGIDHASAVYGNVFQIMEDEGVYLLLGDTYDIYGDWETGHFEDGFDGYWLSLPDGQNLATTIVSIDDKYVIYSSEVLLNGKKETNLRIKQALEDGSIEIEGTWDGIDGNGASDKNIRPLHIGDTIRPLYYSFSMDSDEDVEWEGGDYIVDKDFEIIYALLDTSDYLYSFTIDDIYNDYYMSDFVCFNVNEDGEVSYYLDE